MDFIQTATQVANLKPVQSKPELKPVTADVKTLAQRLDEAVKEGEFSFFSTCMTTQCKACRFNKICEV